MKLDYQLIKDILLTLENYPQHQMSSFDLMNSLKIDENSLEEFIGHIKIMGDYCLIESSDKQGNYGFMLAANGRIIPVNCNYRLTASGYEFLDILKNDTIFKKIKDYAIPNAIEIGKQLLVSFLVKQF